MHVRMPDDTRCRCERCKGRVPLADHEANWKAFGAVLVVPDGHTLRNEEFAVKVPLDEDSFMWVESVAHAEAQTEHHEPGNRNLLIQ
jgi:hypothetical protein